MKIHCLQSVGSPLMTDFRAGQQTSHRSISSVIYNYFRTLVCPALERWENVTKPTSPASRTKSYLPPTSLGLQDLHKKYLSSISSSLRFHSWLMALAESFAEILISEVKRHPNIYDISRHDYRDKDKKIQSWKAISEAIGHPCEYMYTFISSLIVLSFTINPLLYRWGM